MVEAKRITDPSLLQKSDITNELSNLSLETSKPSSESPASQAQQTTLVLLQPLANADMLKVCRNPGSGVMRNSDGAVCGKTNSEYLNIQQLSTAWRQALMKIPPISQLTFDLSLPKKDDQSDGPFERVYWDISIPHKGGLGVDTQQLMTLVITIATGMKMRASGDVRFEVTYDETEGVSREAMTLLKKQLLALSEYKAPVIKGEERGHEDDVQK